MQIKDIVRARSLINNYIHKTPMMSSRSLDELIGGKNYFKCENLQKTGSFKVRGAFNNILSNLDENRKNGIIAFSSGNHAQAVSYAALVTGIKATIVMLESVNPIKLAATRSYGAEVVLFGNDSEEMESKAYEIIKKENLNLIHPFEDFETIAGQGTIGLEIIEDFKDNIDEIYIPIGGGGLISGVSVSIKNLSPKTKVIGIQPETSSSMYKSIKNNRISSVDSCNTIADGLVAKSPGENTFNIVKEFVDDIVLISEKEIKEAALLLLLRTKMLVEPSGAITLAAMAKNKSKQPKNRISVLSGGNFNTMILEDILKNYNNNLC